MTSLVFCSEGSKAMDMLWDMARDPSGDGDFDRLSSESRRLLTEKSEVWRKKWRDIATVCAANAIGRMVCERVGKALRYQLKEAPNSALAAFVWGPECAPNKNFNDPMSLNTTRSRNPAFLLPPRMPLPGPRLRTGKVYV